MSAARTVASFLAVVLVTSLAAATVGIVDDPLSIPPGTHGYCLTEMTGGTIERIPVTILGPQGPVTPEGEMVLIRLDDPRFAKTGIIAGMSGSPVYVDGKLLGALAFGWSFEREPIGGVTPFVRMLGLDGQPRTTPHAAPRPALSTIVHALRRGTLPESVLDWLAPSHRAGGHALPLTVMLGPGRSHAATAWLGPLIRDAGVQISGGTRQRGAPAAGRPPVPGSMVAVVLVNGDATIAAAGTVTEVRGNRIWAFGHPFLKAGSVRLPLAQATVIGVLPNLNASFKFFTVGPMLGEITADRARGIFGALGTAAPMVPMTIDAGGRRYRFRIVPDPALAPLLTAYLVQASQAAHGRGFGEQTLRMKMKLRFEDGSSLHLSESFARTDAPAQAAALAAALLGYVEGSPFQPPAVGGIMISLASVEKATAARLIEAFPQRTVVHPGDEVQVVTRWRVHHGGEIDHVFSLAVPGSIPPGPLDLIVADGGAWSAYDLKVRPMRPASFADEERLIGRLVPTSTVVVALERKDTGIVVHGGTISAPPSVLLSLRAGLDGGIQTAGSRIVATSRADLGMPLSGAVRLRLMVREDGLDRVTRSHHREVR